MQFQSCLSALEVCYYQEDFLEVLQRDCEVFINTADPKVTDFPRYLSFVYHFIWNQLDLFAPDVAHQGSFKSNELKVGHFVIFVNLNLKVLLQCGLFE